LGHNSGGLVIIFGGDFSPCGSALIGRTLFSSTAPTEVERAPGRLSGRIIETEAYPVGDAAGHAYHRKTQRNQSLFLERGHAYVDLTYGTSFLLNVTSEVAGVGAGVLLRAIEPLETPADGSLLICCSRPRADIEIDL
jgi:DNA-3-methyladenine glycosylase